MISSRNVHWNPVRRMFAWTSSRGAFRLPFVSTGQPLFSACVWFFSACVWPGHLLISGNLIAYYPFYWWKKGSCFDVTMNSGGCVRFLLWENKQHNNGTWEETGTLSVVLSYIPLLRCLFSFLMHRPVQFGALLQFPRRSQRHRRWLWGAVDKFTRKANSVCSAGQRQSPTETLLQGTLQLRKKIFKTPPGGHCILISSFYLSIAAFVHSWSLCFFFNIKVFWACVVWLCSLAHCRHSRVEIFRGRRGRLWLCVERSNVKMHAMSLSLIQKKKVLHIWNKFAAVLLWSILMFKLCFVHAKRTVQVQITYSHYMNSCLHAN